MSPLNNILFLSKSAASKNLSGINKGSFSLKFHSQIMGTPTKTQKSLSQQKRVILSALQESSQNCLTSSIQSSIN